MLQLNTSRTFELILKWIVCPHTGQHLRKTHFKDFTNVCIHTHTHTETQENTHTAVLQLCAPQLLGKNFETVFVWSAQSCNKCHCC